MLRELRNLRDAIGTKNQLRMADRAWAVWLRYERFRRGGLHMGVEMAIFLGLSCGAIMTAYILKYGPLNIIDPGTGGDSYLVRQMGY